MSNVALFVKYIERLNGQDSRVGGMSLFFVHPGFDVFVYYVKFDSVIPA
jgi:hypothetical protein